MLTKTAFLNGANSVVFTVQTFLISTFILFIGTLIFRRNEYRKLTPKKIAVVAIAGILQSAIGTLIANIGLSYTTATNSAFLNQAGSIFTIILAFFLLKEELNRDKILAIILVIIGAFLLTTKGNMSVPNQGDILIIIGCVFFSIATIILRKFLRDNEISSAVIAVLRAFAGGITMIIFVLLSKNFPGIIKDTLDQNLFELSHWQLLLANASVGAFTIYLLSKSLKIGSATYISIMSALVPVIVAIASYFVFFERLEPIETIGGGMIIIALLFSNKREKQALNILLKRVLC